MISWVGKPSVFFALWFIYYLSESLLQRESLFRQSLLLVLLFLSAYYFVKVVFSNNNSVYFVGLNLLLAMFVVYGAYLIIWFNPLDYHIHEPCYNYLKVILRSLLPIYAFYYFTKNGLISDKFLQTSIVLLFVLLVAEYFGNKQKMLAMALSINSKKDEIVNNVGYSFLMFLPACILLRNKGLRFLLGVASCIFILMAMKRGAVLIAIICLFLILIYEMKAMSSKKMVIWLITFPVGICICYLLLQHVYSESLLFQQRIEDTIAGHTSRRDDLFAYFLNLFWSEASPLQYVFGFGANATVKYYYNYAHNDWLEIAVNQGVFGLMIYMLYWIIFAKVAFVEARNRSIKMALQMCFFICFFKTFFSMSYGSMPLPATFILGYCLAQDKNENIVQRKIFPGKYE